MLFHASYPTARRDGETSNYPGRNYSVGMTPDDRTRFIQAADVFLLVCEDDAAKRKAGERLLNVLVDLWQSSGPGMFHYRGNLFFTTPGESGEWRLGVYPDRMVVEVD